MNDEHKKIYINKRKELEKNHDDGRSKGQKRTLTIARNIIFLLAKSNGPSKTCPRDLKISRKRPDTSLSLIDQRSPREIKHPSFE